MAKKTIQQQLADCVREAENRRTIAQATGINESTLSRIASGQRSLSGQVVDTLAKYFRLTLKPDRKS